MLFAHQRIGTPLGVGCEVAVFHVAAGKALVASSVVVWCPKMESKGRRRRVMYNSLEANPVAALTELL